ncbi:MAG: rhodanese-like domain-containing protein [Gammaproteobacteria bacterium]|nr:rhodanese-like domain-containing protein [Gammaproteobacteria bacterium]MDH5800451.1 rhodanese-like domain-containing protein [Gammaproteobacteria bacterium]
MQAIPRTEIATLLGICLLVVLFAVSNAGKPTLSTPHVESMSVSDAILLLAQTGVLVLDVREKSAYDKDHIPNAVSVPIGELERRLDEFATHKTKEIIVYCNEGSSRGPRATALLNKAGFVGAKNLIGGMEAWRAQGPVAIKTQSLNPKG